MTEEELVEYAYCACRMTDAQLVTELENCTEEEAAAIRDELRFRELCRPKEGQMSVLADFGCDGMLAGGREPQKVHRHKKKKNRDRQMTIWHLLAKQKR